MHADLLVCTAISVDEVVDLSYCDLVLGCHLEVHTLVMDLDLVENLVAGLDTSVDLLAVLLGKLTDGAIEQATESTMTGCLA